MRPHEELQVRWEAFENRDLEEERLWREQRIQELVEKFERPDRELPEDLARQRVDIELFCRWRIFLPRLGLRTFDGFERAGFYFRDHDEQLTRALIPDEWQLAPSVDFYKSPVQAPFAYLIPPSTRTSFARIFYTHSSAVYRASIALA